MKLTNKKSLDTIFNYISACPLSATYKYRHEVPTWKCLYPSASERGVEYLAEIRLRTVQLRMLYMSLIIISFHANACDKPNPTPGASLIKSRPISFWICRRKLCKLLDVSRKMIRYGLISKYLHSPFIFNHFLG